MSNFSERHNGLNESDINKMLKDIGVDSIDKLIDQTIPSSIKLPDNQQDRDMIARELLVKFQMSPKHPLVDLKKAYLKFQLHNLKLIIF